MIVIVDLRTGNIGSIANMLKKIGVEACVSSKHEDIRNAEKLILPGVGAFDRGMKNLNDSGIREVLYEMVVEKETAVLGICLGMQLFCEKSEEGMVAGLGWIEAETVKFRFEKSIGGPRVPHMGWNRISITKVSPLYCDMHEEPRFYFAHSYHVVCSDVSHILSLTHYGCDFASSIQKNNIYGVQFHPEKSHKFGMKLLQNFTQNC